MKLSELFREGEKGLLAREYESALQAFCEVCAADPQHLWVRFKIGATLEALLENNRAFEIYKALAWHCIKAGYPLLGLVATKRAARLQAGFENTLTALAELYGLESDRLDPSTSLPEPQGLSEQTAAEPLSLRADKLCAHATQLARNFGDPLYPHTLPPIPLFSLLSVEAFYPILELLQLRTFRPGEVIVQQGDPCLSVFMLAHGEVEVVEGRDEKSRTLARLASGAVFGEMALITDAPRVASARAIRESEVLELRRDEMEAAAEDLDDITWALAKFTRQRFINNLLLTSPIFQPFPPAVRSEILERFTSVGVPTEEVIIQEGDPGKGLYIILGGEVEVTKQEGDTRVHLARLPEGSVLGEISLVRDTPTTATVQAVRGGEFLFLSREDFLDLVAERPEIRKTLEDLSEDRLREQSQALAAADDISLDGSVIF